MTTNFEFWMHRGGYFCLLALTNKNSAAARPFSDVTAERDPLLSDSNRDQLTMNTRETDDQVRPKTDRSGEMGILPMTHPHK
jgi:hypothetical protein